MDRRRLSLSGSASHRESRDLEDQPLLPTRLTPRSWLHSNSEDSPSLKTLVPDSPKQPPLHPERPNEKTANPREQLVAGVAYVLTSSALILFNKAALSTYDFKCPNILLLFHCILAVVMLQACALLGYIKLEPLRWRIVKIWLPVNVLFVGMIVTSFLALKLIGVGMFTVLKNMSNFITMIGDYVFFGRTYPLSLWLCLVLMVGSAACGGLTDVRFSWAGYTWQFVNCLFTSAYALYLSRVVEKVSQLTADKQKFSEFSMVYYNNLLSIGLVVFLALASGEFWKLPYEPALAKMDFQLVAFMGGVLGFGISFSSLWFISRSTATVYSLTGSLNKVVVSIVGIVLFNEAASLRNLLSITVGLTAGVIFVLAKAYS